MRRNSIIISIIAGPTNQWYQAIQIWLPLFYIGYPKQLHSFGKGCIKYVLGFIDNMHDYYCYLSQAAFDKDLSYWVEILWNIMIFRWIFELLPIMDE